MALVRLNIPVLVKNTRVDNRNFYYLRPLFVGHPVASHRRLDMATSYLRNEIKQYFKGMELKRGNLEQLLWYQFNPDTAYHLFDFNFRIGDFWVDGVFGVVSFVLQDMTFVCLPNVNNFMFIADTKPLKTPQLRAKTEQVLKKIIAEAQTTGRAEL